MISPIRVTAVSTSIALVATQAIAAVSEQQDIQVRRDFSISADLEAQIDAALAKRDVRETVGTVFGQLSRRLVTEDGRLEDQLFPTFDGEDKSLREIFVAQNQDATAAQGGGGAGVGAFNVDCYSNCHGACHHACHGSRGWR